MHISQRFISVLSLVLGVSTVCSASLVTVGTPADAGTGNCIPFGCAFNGTYQQVYTNTLFSGPITITGLEFFNTQTNSGATAMNTGTFSVYLSTATANWNTLSNTPANNVGANNTQVFSGSLAQAWAFGDTLTITFTTPFTYTPGSGANLLMEVLTSGAGDAGGDIFLDSNGYNGGAFNGDTILGRYYNGTDTSGAASGLNSGYGLVTGFVTSSAPAPEPASFALFGLALIGMQTVRVRRNRKS